MNISPCRSAILISYAAMCGVSTAAMAQSDAAASAEIPQAHNSSDGQPALEDIVVTARKVAERLQDVPVAVTALSGSTLERQNIVQVQDLARVAPGLTMRPATSQASGLGVQLRGQFQNDIVSTVDPSVGTYVDGFYWARAFGLNADLVDIDSVEVLRGPQGTLFGRNTTGGAALVQTHDPDPTKFSGLVSATYGRFDERSMTGVINIPIVEDRIAIRLAGNFLKRDGSVDSVPFNFNGVDVPTAVATSFPFSEPGSKAGSVGRKIGGRNNYTIRGKILVEATDNFRVVLSAEQFRFASYAQTFRLAALDTRPGVVSNTEAGLELGATPANAAALGQQFFAAYIPFTQNSDKVSLNEDPYFYTKTQTYLGTATLDTFFGSVKFIGGYRNIHAIDNIDLDGSPIYLLGTRQEQDISQYSGELQISGRTLNDLVEFTMGAFYFREYGYERSTTVSLPAAATLATGPTSLNQSYSYGDVETRSQGVYGQATVNLTDALSMVGGLRYSAEDKELAVYNRVQNRATGALVACSLSGTSPTSTPQPCRARRSDPFEGLSYTVGINYKLNPDALIYIKTSKGFRSGGQQLRASGANAGFIPFRPEVSHEHELGVKTQLFDRRLRINMAAFLNHVTDLQRSASRVITEGTTTTSASIIDNAGKSRTYGGELEVTAALFNGFTLNGTAAYIKPKYISFSTPNGTSGAMFDRRSERFDQVPRWQWSLGGNYEHPFDWGKIALNANYSWQGKTPIREVNFDFDPVAGVARDVSSTSVYNYETGKAILAATTQKAGGQLDLRAVVTVMDGAVDIAAWGRNVTNFRPNVAALVFGVPLSGVSVIKRDPASFGGTITYRFGN